MNTEEERKAFLDFMDNIGDRQITWLDVWLAAKAHAEEIAKPTVKITSSSRESAPYPYIVSLFEGETFNGVLEDFTTKEDAEAWARNCGYRVIE